MNNESVAISLMYWTESPTLTWEVQVIGFSDGCSCSSKPVLKPRLRSCPELLSSEPIYLAFFCIVLFKKAIPVKYKSLDVPRWSYCILSWPTGWLITLSLLDLLMSEWYRVAGLHCYVRPLYFIQTLHGPREKEGFWRSLWQPLI